MDKPEHDAGVRPERHATSFLTKRDKRPTVAEVIRRAAEPRALMEWEAQHGLTVASVSRYISNVANF